MNAKLEQAVADRFEGARLFVYLETTAVITGNETLITDPDLDKLADRIQSGRVKYGEDRAGSCPDCRIGCMEHSIWIDGVYVGVLVGHGGRGGSCDRNHGIKFSLPYDESSVRNLLDWLRK